MGIRRLLAASLLALSGCYYSPEIIELPQNHIWEKRSGDSVSIPEPEIPEKINLARLEDLLVDDSEEYPLPPRLKNFLDIRYAVDDKKKFSENVFRNAEKLGFSLEKIKSLDALSSITLAADLVAGRMSYEDKDPRKIEEPRKSVDAIFSSGRGDCDKYTKLTAAVFDLFKSVNPRLKNIYFTNNIFRDSQFLQDWAAAINRVPEECSYPEIFDVLKKEFPAHEVNQMFHDWNAVFILQGGKLQIAMIDVTNYDFNGILEALDEEHVDLSSEEWKLRLYAMLELRGRIKDADFGAIKNPRTRQRIMDELAFHYFLNREYQTSLDLYDRLHSENTDDYLMDDYLYYTGLMMKRMGQEEGRKRHDELIKRFPESFFSKILREDN